MRVRYKNNPKITGWSRDLNTHGLGEVIVTFEDGDATSEYISELEVEVNEQWLDMQDAFHRKVILPDNYHTYFGVASEEDQERGYI